MGTDNFITKEARNLVKTGICLHFFHIINDEIIVFVSQESAEARVKMDSKTG